MEISIITPVYNNEEFLKNSIESVINQSDENWELILVNDGSTDNTGEICDEYSQKDRRIKVEHIPNAGPANARNIGVQKANGTYCIFLDSDDLLESEAIKTLKDEVLREEFDIVFYGYFNDVYDNETIVNSIKYTLEPSKYHNNEDFKKVYQNIDEKGFSHPSWNKMFRTSFLKENDITFPYGIFISEDYLFNLKAYSCAEKILILEEKLYHYTSRSSGSITTSFRLNKIKDIESVYEKSYSMVEKWIPSRINNINNEFISNISVYINSLYNEDCSLSENKKKDIVSSIVNSKNVLACLNEISPINWRNRIITKLLKMKAVDLLLLTGKISRINK